jgi:hypothetical protein
LCEYDGPFGVPKFNASGPDVQVVHADNWSFKPGFKCPGTCTNTTKATVAKGKMSFPLVWVDDHPPLGSDGSYTITMHRYKLEVPLVTNGKAVSNTAMYKTGPFTWSHNNQASRVSDAFEADIGIIARADVHTGTGRVAVFKLLVHDPAPSSPEFAWTSDYAGCDQLMLRSDYKAGDGQSSDDDGGSSPSASSSGKDSGNKRACKSQCKSQAGSCRTSCHGQSAKCASSCNHAESDCERGC